jgi:hypothetical protein
MNVETPEDNRKREEARLTEEAYKIAVGIRRAGLDPSPIFNAVLQREQDEFCAWRDAQVPRYRPPILRKGKWNVHYDDALADIHRKQGDPDFVRRHPFPKERNSVVKYIIQSTYKFPDRNYHEMIDGSSNCDWEKHWAYKLPPP